MSTAVIYGLLITVAGVHICLAQLTTTTTTTMVTTKTTTTTEAPVPKVKVLVDYQDRKKPGKVGD